MNIARHLHSLPSVATVCRGGALFVGIGGIAAMMRAAESSLELVGNLIKESPQHLLGRT